MLDCLKKILENECVLSCNLYLLFMYIVSNVFYLGLSIYCIIILCFSEINLLWINVLLSIILINFSNIIIYIFDKNSCNSLKICSYNSCINCIVSTITLINITHCNYDINNLYHCALMLLVTEYILMICNLSGIYFYYYCNKIN